MPHQTASIEGMFGGGVNCRCGEVSLAHKGVLFLDESAEFRTSVLQMLRVPIESKSITLSRAGRTTIYPADFQLFMATNPCPCGNFGSDRICLCSAKSVENYWHKFSAPLLDRIQIKFVFQNNESQLKVKTIDDYRKDIAKARIGLKKRESLSDDEKFQMNEETEVIFATYTLTHNSSHREMMNIKKVARVIADINGNELITKADFDEAINLVCPKGSIFNN
jgi:magnesium chelatase family protein